MKLILNNYERTCVRCKMMTYEGEKVELVSFGVAHLDKDCASKLQLSKSNHPSGSSATVN